MNFNRTLIILIIILITLLVVDLSLGIGYLNKNNLYFDPENFNNILSPIFSLLALFASLIAVLFSFNQNKLALSQNLKPHYELEIERMKAKALGIKIKGAIDENENKTFNALNYIQEIQEKLIKLTQNEEFNEDYRKFQKGEILENDYLTKRSYFGTLLFLHNFTTVLSPIYFFNSTVKELVEKINASKLIEDDKLLIKKRIKSEFVEEYIALVGFMKRHPNIAPPIPELFLDDDSKINFKSMADSHFGTHLKWFEENL